MDPVTIFIAKALICFANTCHPVLLGPDTRPGTYEMNILHTQQAGYGGDVLMYDSNETMWYAIHRTYDYGAVRDRARLYRDTTPEQRMVTAGCPNVEPHVYEELKANYLNSPLVIVE